MYWYSDIFKLLINFYKYDFYFQKFRFDIKDINEHAPTFGESEYTYSVPTPLMPESDLTRYGKSVIVEDLDFSNNNITFSIDPDDFEINAVPVENSKKYVAEFAAKKVLFLKEPKEYTLTATVSIYIFWIWIVLN